MEAFSCTWVEMEDGRWKRLAIPGLRWKMEDGRWKKKTITFSTLNHSRKNLRLFDP
jgi:hypothetical protein